MLEDVTSPPRIFQWHNVSLSIRILNPCHALRWGIFLPLFPLWLLLLPVLPAVPSLRFGPSDFLLSHPRSAQPCSAIHLVFLSLCSVLAAGIHLACPVPPFREQLRCHLSEVSLSSLTQRSNSSHQPFLSLPALLFSILCITVGHYRFSISSHMTQNTTCRVAGIRWVCVFKCGGIIWCHMIIIMLYGDYWS